MGISFKQILLEVANPRLKGLGYEFDDALTDRDITFTFCKELGNGTQAFITFQRHQQDEIPYGYGFTVSVKRHKVIDITEVPPRYDKSSFGARLPHLIVDIYGLRLYPRQDHWWESATTEDLRRSIAEATDKLERYGIPVLEDMQFRYITAGLEIDKQNVFREILYDVVSDRLSVLGYKPQDDPIQYWSSSRGIFHRHFVKRLGDDWHAFISFHPLHHYENLLRNFPMTEPEYHYFGILIARKQSSNPHTEIVAIDKYCFQRWLGPFSKDALDIKAVVSRAVLWEYIEAQGPLYDYDRASGTVSWMFPNHILGSLTTQLKKAVAKIEQDGLPLLENI